MSQITQKLTNIYIRDVPMLKTLTCIKSINSNSTITALSRFPVLAPHSVLLNSYPDEGSEYIFNLIG